MDVAVLTHFSLFNLSPVPLTHKIPKNGFRDTKAKEQY